MKPNLVFSSLLLSASALALPAHAEGPPVSIQFNIGAPPPLVYVAPQPVYAPPPVMVAAPPTMIWLPEFSGYVALGLSQPLFYLGGVYYYNSGGRWYTGPRYGGPWHPAERIPPGLRQFHDRDWKRAQDRAYRYDRDPQWRRFRAEGARPGYHPEQGRPGGRPEGGPPGRHQDHGHGPDHYNQGRGNDHGNDRGNGHGRGVNH